MVAREDLGASDGQVGYGAVLPVREAPVVERFAEGDDDVEPGQGMAQRDGHPAAVGVGVFDRRGGEVQQVRHLEGFQDVLSEREIDVLAVREFRLGEVVILLGIVCGEPGGADLHLGALVLPGQGRLGAPAAVGAFGHAAVVAPGGIRGGELEPELVQVGRPAGERGLAGLGRRALDRGRQAHLQAAARLAAGRVFGAGCQEEEGRKGQVFIDSFHIVFYRFLDFARNDNHSPIGVGE